MKKALFAFAVLLLLGAAGVYLAFNYVDVIVKVALEHYGPQVTGVTVKVGRVKISPKDGRGSLRDIELGSPPGFSAPRTARFGEVSVALDPSTITEPVIVIHELVLESPQITYERGDKTTNLDAIQRQIDAYVKRAESAEASKGGDSPIRKREGLDAPPGGPRRFGQRRHFAIAPWAEAVEVHFGDGALSSDDVAAGVVGAVVRDPVHDTVAWREYLEGVVAHRDGWSDFYDACRALE